MTPIPRPSPVLVVGIAALLLAPSPALAAKGDPATPRFVDVTRASGLRHTYEGQRAYVGGGVAVLDCDADGLADLYLAGADRPASCGATARARARRSASAGSRPTRPT